ncbi:MAG: Ldh family oxidoreductase [Phycisphaerales bacterium JB063]
MPQISSHSRYAAAEHLERFCAGMLVAAGLTPADATTVADSLVQSNLRGIDSHGVARLPHYLSRIARGSINPKPDMHLHVVSPSTALIDGDHALGQLVMHRAAREAIHMAEQVGSAWVAVKHSSHCGALSYYGLEVARAGMVGFAFTHVDPMVMPHGARQPFCGTNPLCIAAPAGRLGFELCLDMATSITPWNSVMNAAMEGQPIPPGWGVDDQGIDTTDPHRVNALYPVGEYKGSGLGMMIDVLCALLGGAPFGPDIPVMYGDLTQRRLLGGLVGAIDIKRYVSLEVFEQRALEMVTRWNQMPPARPGERVQYPGEPEARSRVERLSRGIPLGLQLLETFDVLAEQYSIAPLATVDRA